MKVFQETLLSSCFKYIHPRVGNEHKSTSEESESNSDSDTDMEVDDPTLTVSIIT